MGDLDGTVRSLTKHLARSTSRRGFLTTASRLAFASLGALALGISGAGAAIAAPPSPGAPPKTTGPDSIECPGCSSYWLCGPNAGTEVCWYNQVWYCSWWQVCRERLCDRELVLGHSCYQSQDWCGGNTKDIFCLTT